MVVPLYADSVARVVGSDRLRRCMKVSRDGRLPCFLRLIYQFVLRPAMAV